MQMLIIVVVVAVIIIIVFIIHSQPNVFNFATHYMQYISGKMLCYGYIT